MSARCPTCGHGTSGCILEPDEWHSLAEAFDSCMSNIRTYEDPSDCGIDEDEWKAMLNVEQKLLDLPRKDDAGG